MKPASPAHQQFEAWITQGPKGRQAQLARLLGLSSSHVLMWRKNGYQPDPVSMYAIRLLTGIPEEAWLDDEGRARRAAIEQRVHAALAKDLQAHRGDRQSSAAA